MITIKDVAIYSGVSPTTVSRVINGSEKVTPKTKAKVDQAIKELGYFPNKAARSLVTKQADSIAIMFRNLHDPFFSELIHGIEDAAAHSGRNVIFCSPGKNEKVRDRYIEYLTNGISDAIILYGSLFSDKAMIDHLYKVNFPLLLIENNFQTMPVNQFLIDNINGARSAVQYLIKRGHKKIAHVMGNPNKKVILERFSGYTEAMQANGLMIRDYYIQKTQDDSSISMSAFKDMIERPERPTAIFCSDDKIAIQVITALEKLGFSVPEDVSVIGFDNLNSYNNSYRGPRITSVQQPLYQIGYDSILAIDRILKGESTELINKTYSTVLAEHETVSDCSSP
ncbi:MAG: LacI family DNA-binding transcriptional regulator [Clostridiales bacterium]|nr:LacI family DNA-binding transcriptional regulator [Clostridiales bacterium]